MQAQMVLDKGLRVLHPYQQSAGRDCETLAWFNHLRPQNLSSEDTPFLSHTYSNKATIPNSANSYWLMRNIFIQTT